MATISDEEFIEMYGRPPVRKKKPKKRKVYWNRIIIALVLLVMIIFGLVQLVKAVAGHFKHDDSSAAPANVKTQSQSADESGVEELSGDLQFKVCLDAGHGDYDGGTTDLSGTRIEKDDNLRIALAVEKYLKSKGATVVMVREDDTFYELGERCDIANNSKSDLFVSLHRNSYDGEMSGVEIWVHNKQPMEDETLAQNIMSELDSAGISNNRGVQSGYIGMPNENYYVNADTKMPSCLVELGFVTDDTDNQLFDEKLDDYAKAIGDGIIKTAKDLGVIDSDGKRLLNKQLISEDKIYEVSSSESDGEELDQTDSTGYPDEGQMFGQTEYLNG